MRSFSYTKSTSLITYLNQIDALRKNILLHPLSPQQELLLQYNAKCKRIHSLLLLDQTDIPEAEIQLTLSPQGNKGVSLHEAAISAMKNALDYLYHTWLVSDKLVNAQDILALYEIMFHQTPDINNAELDSLLQYIQINPEHPTIQAALIHALMYGLCLRIPHNEVFVPLVGTLFLYKFGYDFKRFAALEISYSKNIPLYKSNVLLAQKEQNLTFWLEYVANLLIVTLEQTYSEIKRGPLADQQQNAPFFMLTDRQKMILDMFNQPGIKWGNKQIQRKFKVSQITASRDLSKLTEIGLIFPVGKGRSTTYFKA